MPAAQAATLSRAASRDSKGSPLGGARLHQVATRSRRGLGRTTPCSQPAA